MSCNGEAVMGLEEGLLLLPSNLFTDVFLDCIISQGHREGRRCDHRKPKMHYALDHHRSIETPPGDGPASPKSSRTFPLERSEQKPRGTGVFLPRTPVTPLPSYKKRLETDKKQPCPVIYSHSKQVFLPKE